MRSLTKLQKITALVTITYAAWVRLQDLGYSEFQGDEILTIDFAEHLKQGKFVEYLLTRDKGPLQYIINLITYKLTGGFDEFWIRLPYALAGILFVWTVFEITRRLAKNNWAGIIAAWFTASNGLFIAFSRITQYQAFVQLLLALTILILTTKRRGKGFGSGAPGLRSKTHQSLALRAKPWGIGAPEVLAGLTFGLATLFHYDALTFLAFAGFFFVKGLLEGSQHSGGGPIPHRTDDRIPPSQGDSIVPINRDSRVTRVLKEAFTLLALFLITTGAFYLPFFLHPSANSTSGYLAERVFGSGFMPRTLYTELLMKFYMPKELLCTLVTLSCLSLYFILKTKNHNSQNATRKTFGADIKHPPARRDGACPVSTEYTGSICRDALQSVSTIRTWLLPAALISTFYFSTLWIKPRGSTLLFYLLTAITIGLLFLNSRERKNSFRTVILNLFQNLTGRSYSIPEMNSKQPLSQARPAEYRPVPGPAPAGAGVQDDSILLASLFAWFLASSCFYLFFNKTPRTHVYIIFIPMFILSGYSLIWLYQLAKQISTKLENWLWSITRMLIKTTLYTTTTIGLILVPIIYNHKIFVEKNPEYLWGNKTVFSREMISIEKNLNSKVQGIFGFPQRREWEEIAQLFEKGCLVGTYSTNEKDRIPAFYIGQTPVMEDTDNIILVESPVSWNYQNIEKTPEGYNLLKTYPIGEHPVTAIYGILDIYPDARMLCE